MKKISESKRNRIKHARGSNSSIAKKYNVSTATVYRIKNPKIEREPELIRTPKQPTLFERVKILEEQVRNFYIELGFKE